MPKQTNLITLQAVKCERCEQLHELGSDAYVEFVGFIKGKVRTQRMEFVEPLDSIERMDGTDVGGSAHPTVWCKVCFLKEYSECFELYKIVDTREKDDGRTLLLK